MPLIQSIWKSRLITSSMVLLTATAGAADSAPSAHGHSVGHATPTAALQPFIASLDKPYAVLVDDAMAVMNHGMAQAPMNGDPDHDFAAMMVPHHQGAVDMAKAELLYGRNPVLRRLAQEIIITQGQEIQVMQGALQKKLPASVTKPR